MGIVVIGSLFEAVTSFKMRYLVGLISFLWILNTAYAKEGKLLPFQIIKFPNDPCDVSGTKNGTCYTSEECSDKGGTSIGSCAEGYGVCCTFSIGCDGSSSENCTYIEIMSPSAGKCTPQICPTTSNICQIRLELETFVITGPSTISTSVGLFLGGEGSAGGIAMGDKGTCKSDTFSITGASHIPVLCGTLTGEHLYIDADTDCNNLNFNFAQSAVGISNLATRSITIKALQLGCGNANLAPSGCAQYFFGTGGASTFKSFGYDGSSTDVQLSGIKATKTATGYVSVKDSMCCGYGADGKGSSYGVDCLMIPGAVKGVAPYTAQAAISQCGAAGGLAYSAGVYKTGSTTTGHKTVCSSSVPFRIAFFSDAFEHSGTADGINSYGFKLSYFQRSC